MLSILIISAQPKERCRRAPYLNNSNAKLFIFMTIFYHTEIAKSRISVKILNLSHYKAIARSTSFITAYKYTIREAFP